MRTLQQSLTITLVAAGALVAACADPPAAVSTPAAGVAAAIGTPPAGSSPVAAGIIEPAGTPAVRPVSQASSRFQVEPAGTRASFRVREQLARVPLPSDAVGTTTGVSGSITFGPDGKLASDQSKLIVDLSSLQTDESRRDQYIKRNTLETARFPTAEFVAREVQGLPFPLPTSGQQTFQVAGDMTIHGVTRPVTWNVTGTFDEDVISGQASTQFTFEDFGMSPPSTAVVLSVENQIRLEVDFRLVADS